MNASLIAELITLGESRTVEFKKAKTAIPKSLYETVCAFLNRDGGISYWVFLMMVM